MCVCLGLTVNKQTDRLCMTHDLKATQWTKKKGLIAIIMAFREKKNPQFGRIDQAFSQQNRKFMHG